MWKGEQVRRRGKGAATSPLQSSSSLELQFGATVVAMARKSTFILFEDIGDDCSSERKIFAEITTAPQFYVRVSRQVHLDVSAPLWF